MAEIVNLRNFRKRAAREAADREAEANRASHGRSKAERRKAAQDADRMRRTLDGAALKESGRAAGMAGNADADRSQESAKDGPRIEPE